MALNLVPLSNLFLLLLLFAVNDPFTIVVESRTEERTEQYPFTKTLQNLEGVHKGQTVKGLSELRRYLQKFGYLTTNDDSDHSNVASPRGTLADHFDENLESALKDYQTYHHLDVTGRVDAATIEKMSLPRCGVPDISQHDHNKRIGLGLVMVMAANYSFLPGSPKWQDSKKVLTYSFHSSADVTLSIDDVRQACGSAFQSWSKVSNFQFSETQTGGDGDIVIGFHRGDHGDGYPFDGPGQVLAHSFAPEDGRLHYDADEQWSTTAGPTTVQPRLSRHRRRRNRQLVFDLETVALHEIGHILGLGHSSDVDSIMYPSYLGPRRDLKQDDIDGIRALYGYN